MRVCVVRVAAQRCAGIQQERYASGPAELLDLRDGLAGPHLRVGGLEHRGGDPTAIQRPGIRGDVDPPGAVDGHRRARARLEEDHGALRRTRHDAVADAAPGVAEPGQTQLEGRLGAGVDRQLVGPDAERLGQHRACGVEERPGLPTRGMQPGGVGPGGLDGVGQRPRRQGVERAPRGVEETGRSGAVGGGRHA